MTRALALVVLALFAVASALGVVHARHEARVAYAALVQLEQATWAETNRVEQIAIADLGMVHPDPATTRVVRR